jgi:hypothetical protein
LAGIGNGPAENGAAGPFLDIAHHRRHILIRLVLFGEVQTGELAEEFEGFAVVGAGGLDGRGE